MSKVPVIRRREPLSVSPREEIVGASMPGDATDPTAYAIGYGKPPVDTRFGGARGNRPGRKKGARSRSTIIEEELNAKVAVAGHGKLSKYQLAIRQLANQAAKGDLKAMLAVIKLGVEQDRERHMRDQQAPVEPTFDDHDRSVLEILADLARETAAVTAVAETSSTNTLENDHG